MTTGNNIEIKECHDSENWTKDIEDYAFSIFHCKEWIEAISITANVTPVYIDLYHNGLKEGKTSGIIHKTKYFGKQLYFFSGPAVRNNNTKLYADLINALIKFYRSKGISRIVIGSYGSQFAPEIKLPLCYSFKRKEFIVDLTCDFTKRFSRNIRRNIRKAQSASFKIKSDRTDISVLKNLLESTLKHRLKKYRSQYETLPLPFLNFKSLEKLSDTDLSNIHIAISENKTAGFLLTLEKHPHSEALLTGIDEQFYKTGISPFMYEYTFKKLKSAGFISINLGGIPEGEDGKKLANFKKSLGAEEITVYGATTNFLIYPYKLLNPILNIGRKLPRNNPVVQFLKKFI